MKRILSDRKTLYFILSIILVCVFTLSVVYAALSATLRVNGNAEVVASNWDIYLDNVQLVSGSATTAVPTITDKTTASFSTTLTNPGDYYMFTVDVVNNGTIDAMIDNIVKSPELSDTQKKYLNYIVEYQSGESINTKQLVEANSFVRLKVKVEFRKDIVASDLPTAKETLNLSFSVKYTQANDSGTVSVPNSGKLVKVVSGNYDTVGSEVAIGDEHFYIISNTEVEITILSKYNLYVGNECTSSCTPYGEEATGIQDSTMLGFVPSQTVRNGTAKFSNTNYWKDTTSTYPAYVYNENSYLYEYVENYKSHLEGLGAEVNEARLITIEELESLGCSRSSESCSGAPEWVYSTTYWSGSAFSITGIWRVNSNGFFGSNPCTNASVDGVRPVIVIDRSLL